MEVPKIIKIKQKAEVMESLTGAETKNQYSIKDKKGDTIGYAAEKDTNLMSGTIRNVAKKSRPIRLEIFDKNKNLNLVLTRKLKAFKAPEFEVKNPEEKTLVKIKLKRSFLRRKMEVIYNDETLFTIKSKGMIFGANKFMVLRKGEEKSRITKEWKGIFGESFSDADNFGANFENIRDNQWREVLIATVFAIDLTYYEH